MNPFRRKHRIHLTVGDHDVSFLVRRDAAEAIAFLWADHEETLAQLDRAKAENAAFTEEAEQVMIATTAMREAHHRQVEGLNSLVHGLQQALAVERKASQAEVHRLDAENVQLAAELLEVSGRLATAEEQLAAERVKA